MTVPSDDRKLEGSAPGSLGGESGDAGAERVLTPATGADSGSDRKEAAGVLRAHLESAGGYPSERQEALNAVRELLAMVERYENALREQNAATGLIPSVLAVLNEGASR